MQIPVKQQRFCSWGLLSTEYMKSLVSTSNMSPPSSNASTLLCQDICPHAPCSLPLRLPYVKDWGAAGANISWLAVDQQAERLNLPAAISPQMQSWTLQGDGGRGWYCVRHSRMHREHLRAAVSSLAAQLDTCSSTTAAADKSLPLLTAGTLMADQMHLGMSVFQYGNDFDGDYVLGSEVVDAMWAAASSPAALSNGCGQYALVLPALDAMEQLGDRLSGNMSCWRDFQVRLSSPPLLLSLQ